MYLGLLRQEGLCLGRLPDLSTRGNNMELNIRPILIKIEPNTGVDRVNDGGFEALLDEFGPETNQPTSLIKSEPEEQNSQSQTEVDPNRTSHLEHPIILPPVTLIKPNKQKPRLPGVKKKKVNLNKRRKNIRKAIFKAASQICPSITPARLVPPLNNNEGVILPKGYPKVTLSEEQSHLVQQELVKFMLEDPTLVPDLWYPRFNDCYFKEGAIFFNGRDLTTLHWITTTLPKISLWLGTDLRAVDVADFPKFIKVEAWVKNLTLDDTQLLRLLQKQNGGNSQPIRTQKWVICERSAPSERGTRLVIGVDEESLKILRKTPEVFLGMGKVKFVFPAEKDVPPNPLTLNGVPPLMGPIVAPQVQQPTSTMNNVRPALQALSFRMYNRPLWK